MFKALHKHFIEPPRMLLALVCVEGKKEGRAIYECCDMSSSLLPTDFRIPYYSHSAGIR